MLDNDIVKMRCEAPFRASVSEPHLSGSTRTATPSSTMPERRPITARPPATDGGSGREGRRRDNNDGDRRRPRAASAAAAGEKPSGGGRLEDRRRLAKTRPAARWPFAGRAVRYGFPAGELAPWVADIADRMQCPIDYVAIPAMTSLGATIGRRIAIRPQRNTDWSEVANLWALIIGPPGVMKSPAMAEATKTLRRLEMEARKNKETAMKSCKAAVEDHKMRTEAAQRRFKDALKKDPNAAPPRRSPSPSSRSAPLYRR